jgi:hypothetical protein
MPTAGSHACKRFSAGTIGASLCFVFNVSWPKVGYRRQAVVLPDHYLMRNQEPVSAVTCGIPDPIDVRV